MTHICVANPSIFFRSRGRPTKQCQAKMSFKHISSAMRIRFSYYISVVWCVMQSYVVLISTVVLHQLSNFIYHVGEIYDEGKISKYTYFKQRTIFWTMIISFVMPWCHTLHRRVMHYQSCNVSASFNIYNILTMYKLELWYVHFDAPITVITILRRLPVLQEYKYALFNPQGMR